MPPKTILFYLNILLFANIVLSVITNSGIQSIAGGPSPSAMGEQINGESGGREPY